MSNVLQKLFGIKEATPKQVKNNNITKTYTPDFSCFDYGTDSTNDWSKTKKFESNLFDMSTIEKPSDKVDFSQYNEFDEDINNPSFDLPVAQLG